MKKHIRKSRLHKFHIRYKWAGLLLLVTGAIFVWHGFHEVGTVSLGLAFESVLHHAIEFVSEEV